MRAMNLGAAAVVLSAALACSCQTLLSFGPDEGADAGAAADAGGNGDVDSLPAVDAASGDAGARDKPSYCQGASAYFPLDGTYRGPGGLLAGGTIGSFDAGWAEGGVYLSDAASVVLPAVLLRPESTTIAMRIRPSWGLPCTTWRTLLKSELDHAPWDDGPMLQCQPGGGFTLQNFGPDGGATKAELGATVPWRANDWNFVAVVWGPTGGLGLWINDAANVATQAWEFAAGEPMTFVRVSHEQQPLDSAVDELIVWKRVLEAAELTALQNATAPFGVVCL